jgi:hypothetical protein
MLAGSLAHRAAADSKHDQPIKVSALGTPLLPDAELHHGLEGAWLQGFSGWGADVYMRVYMEQSPHTGLARHPALGDCMAATARMRCSTADTRCSCNSSIATSPGSVSTKDGVAMTCSNAADK